MSGLAESDIIYLGVCDRANYDTNRLNWNILGLGNVVYCYIFPYNFLGLHIGINISEEFFNKNYSLHIVDDTNNEITAINISAEEYIDPDASKKYLKQSGTTVWVPPSSRATFFLPLNEVGLIQKPGVYKINCQTEKGSREIGFIQFVLVNPPPLDLERITAIKSIPDAAEAVQIDISCKICSSIFRTYAALDRNLELQKAGYEWYEYIPDYFNCECGKLRIDLQYIRNNLHGLLGTKTSKQKIFNFIPLYEKNALKTIRSQLIELLREDPSEETLQTFICENPILLHQFTAEKIIPKPPILTSYVADFAILTSQKELVLIEIEKSSTRLMKKDGHRASGLVHAFDQVRDWLHMIDEYRLAVLNELDIDKDQVSTIRGVVIAGRETGYDAKKLRGLKMSKEERINFLTYDDLLFALEALINNFDRF